ncbi:MAG: glucose-6-phosphate isomerase [Bdellovibrionota bacterium]
MTTNSNFPPNGPTATADGNAIPLRTVHPENLRLARQSLDQVLKANLGFVELFKRKHLLDEIETVFKKRGQQFRQAVVVGIGGSSLGVRVIRDFFNKEELLVLENVDHRDFTTMTKWIREPKECIFVFTSKSGGTLETLVSLELIQEWLKQKGLALKDQAVVITETKESSLYTWSQKNHVPYTEVPKDVGGRFSVLTPVGMFPARLMGLNPSLFWKGAEKVLANDRDLVNFIGEALESFDRQKWITQFWLYGTSLKTFGDWLVQLWSESLGKKMNRKGLESPRASTPMVAVGAIDQHSMLQQTMEGYKDKWPVFIRAHFLEQGGSTLHKSLFPETALVEGKKLGDVLRIEAQATREALEAQDISTFEINFSEVKEEVLGYWFFFFELAVAALGESMQINAFDQPGVELGKRLAQEKLKVERLSAP